MMKGRSPAAFLLPISVAIGERARMWAGAMRIHFLRGLL
jgi:hypothetical protein